jgi:hypothetical protein
MSKLSLFKLWFKLGSNFDSNQAPGVLLGANGQPGSMAIGNTVDVTRETADCARGNA